MVASFYAGILALMLIALSANVIRARRRYRIALGDNNNEEIKRRMRAQTNFTEYSLFFLVLLSAAEYNMMPSYIVHLFGIIFIIGRIMHAYSLLKAEQYIEGKITSLPVWRKRGMTCTFGCIGLLAIILIEQYVVSFWY